MKIFVTEFEHKGKVYAGPNIIAEDQEIAEQTAKASGYVGLGEIQALYVEDINQKITIN